MRIVLSTGTGWVGKTSTAAAVAVRAVRTGMDRPHPSMRDAAARR